MKKPGIRITRNWYEEPYALNLFIEASNGRCRGALEYYCNAEDLGTLGKQFEGFTGTRDKEFVYVLGSEKPKDRSAFFLSLRVMSLDSSGHCALLIRMNNNESPPGGEISEFSILADIADLNRLGVLLSAFGRLEHRVLEWEVQDGRLIKGDEETL